MNAAGVRQVCLPLRIFWSNRLHEFLSFYNSGAQVVATRPVLVLAIGRAILGLPTTFAFWQPHRLGCKKLAPPKWLDNLTTTPQMSISLCSSHAERSLTPRPGLLRRGVLSAARLTRRTHANLFRPISFFPGSSLRPFGSSFF